MRKTKSYIHTIKTPYFSLKQKIDLCWPTFWQTESKRRGVEYDQEYLAAYLEVYVSEEHKDSYHPILRSRALPKIEYIDKKTGEIKKRDDARVGFLIERIIEEEFQYKIKRLGYEEVSLHRPSELGLIEVVSSIDEIRKCNRKDISQFIGSNLDEENAVGMNFRWDELRGTKDGHYVLICAYNEKSNLVTVVDPSPINPAFWSEDLDRFLYGMQPIWEEDDDKIRERGFILIKGPDKLKKIDIGEPDNLYKGAPLYTPVVYKIKRETIDPSEYPTPKTN